YFAGAVFAPFAIESFGWTGMCVIAAALTLAAGIGPAYLARTWRRHIRVPEEGHVPASVWEPRLLALFVSATVQLGLYAGILVALHTWQDAGAAAGALLGGVLAAIGAGPALLAGAALLGLTLPLWWAAMRP